ncbi:hypothetical protein K443DRAFT_509133 [Laccaria amethystina LaAM-08-1]|uniref:Uncharacterized protein n=1 Tax=Laccaria amethystina LaAM-08-1 TaxID=1095629 RepID=A0A0C9XYD3_9AGAR|nr:hypothetical protein K443DRAFT_509133 [Laccaria amethystina LaAM-08-1]
MSQNSARLFHIRPTWATLSQTCTKLWPWANSRSWLLLLMSLPSRNGGAGSPILNSPTKSGGSLVFAYKGRIFRSLSNILSLVDLIPFLFFSFHLCDGAGHLYIPGVYSEDALSIPVTGSFFSLCPPWDSVHTSLS